MRKFCESREFHTAYHGYLDEVDNLARELKTLFGLIEMYYDEYDGETTISQDTLVTYYDIKYPKSKSKEFITSIIGDAFNMELSDELIKTIVDQLLEKHEATRIINKLLPVMEGDKYEILHTIKDDVESFISLLNNPPESAAVPEPCLMSLDELIEQEIMDEGLPWHLRALQNIVGGVRSKTLGLIYAFVDSGKTSFSLRSMAAQASALPDDGIICYCGNEESAPRLSLRAIQAFTGLTRGQIKAQRDKASELARASGFHKVRIFDNIVNGSQIKYVLDTYKPTVLYVDQATDVDIDTRRKSDGVEYLKQLFKWYRRMASIHDTAIIGVAQGVGDAENTKYLKLSDIYGSRVAIQGALDYGIGIGRVVDDPTLDNIRYINIPKNKLYDGDGGRFIVEFNKQTCSWRET